MAANSIGISEAMWRSCFTCNTPRQCTRVRNGSSFDQFSQFRNATLAAASAAGDTSCQYQEDLSNLLASALQPVVAISCRSPGQNITITITLNAALFKLAINSPGQGVAQSTAFVYTAGSISLGVQVKNSAPSTQNFTLRVQECCQIANDTVICTSQQVASSTVYIDAGQTSQLQSPALSKLKFTQPGGCTANLMQGNVVLQYIYAALSATSLLPQVDPAAPPGESVPTICSAANGFTNFSLGWGSGLQISSNTLDANLVR